MPCMLVLSASDNGSARVDAGSEERGSPGVWQIYAFFYFSITLPSPPRSATD